MISIYFLNIFCMNFDVGIRSTGGQKSHRPLPGSWTYKKQKWESKFVDSLWEFSCLCGKSKDFMLCMVCHQGNCKLKPHLLEWPKSRTQTTAGAGEDVEPRELSLVAGGDAKWCSLFGRHLVVSYRMEHFFCVVVVQLLNCVWFFATPWATAHQASLSITNSQGLLRLCWVSDTIQPSYPPAVVLLGIYPNEFRSSFT